jgi:hypothetical protein
MLDEAERSRNRLEVLDGSARCVPPSLDRPAGISQMFPVRKKPVGSKADKFFALIEDYRAERERLPKPTSQSDNWKAKTLFGHLRDSLPGLTQAAYVACERLSDFIGVRFESPHIAIAGEDIATLNRNTERIEHEEMHRF